MAKGKTKQAAGDPLALVISDMLDPGFTALGPITRTMVITATIKRGKTQISKH